MHAITITARQQAALNVFRNIKVQCAASAGKFALSKMLQYSETALLKIPCSLHLDGTIH